MYSFYLRTIKEWDMLPPNVATSQPVLLYITFD